MGHALLLLLLSCALRIGHPPATAAHKASLWVIPTGATVPMRQQVSLHCLCQVPCTRLFLYRGTSPVPVRYAEAQGQAAEFPISHAGPGDSGSYRCRYLSRGGLPRWSESSDPVHLVVEGTSPDSSHISPLEPPSPDSSRITPPEITNLDSSRITPPELTSPTLPELPRTGLSPSPSSAAPVPPTLLDFTHGNVLRLGLGAGVLLALGLILAESCCSWERRGLQPSERLDAEQGLPSRTSCGSGVPHWVGCASLLTCRPKRMVKRYKQRESGETGDCENWQLQFSVTKCKAAPIGKRRPDCAHKNERPELAVPAPERS